MTKKLPVFVKALFSLKFSLYFKRNQRLNALLKNFETSFRTYINIPIILNFDYVLKNFDTIYAWLSSSEFKEKFHNHPYPSLLNPEKIDYESINAELAWRLNLPLPPFYNLLILRGHGSGGNAMVNFLRSCEVNVFNYWQQPRKAYYIHYKDLMKHSNEYNALDYTEWGSDDYHPNAWSANKGYDRNKLYTLTDKKVPVVIQLRDPIAQIKHRWGRIWTDMKKTWKNTFYLGEDILEKIPIIQPKKEVIFSNKKLNIKRFKSDFFIRKKLYNIFKPNVGEFIFLDMSEISKDRAFDTVTRLSQKLHFNAPKEEHRKTIFEALQTGGRSLSFIIPLTLIARARDIGEESEEEFKITIKETPKAFSKLETNEVDITSEILGYTPKEFAFAIKKSEYEIFKKNSKFFEAIKQNLRDFAHKLEKRIELEESLMPKEKDVLEYLRANKKARAELKEILDDDLSFVKELRPDIVDSWRYYKEFEKMCAELDGKE